MDEPRRRAFIISLRNANVFDLRKFLINRRFSIFLENFSKFLVDALQGWSFRLEVPAKTAFWGSVAMDAFGRPVLFTEWHPADSVLFEPPTFKRDTFSDRRQPPINPF